MGRHDLENEVEASRPADRDVEMADVVRSHDKNDAPMLVNSGETREHACGEESRQERCIIPSPYHFVELVQQHNDLFCDFEPRKDSIRFGLQVIEPSPDKVGGINHQ